MIKNRGAIVALLTGLNFINYLDRFMLAAVLPRILAPESEGGLGLNEAEGGLLATVPVIFSLPLVTDAAGEFLLGNIPGGGGPVTFYLQCASLDGGMPYGVSLSNAVQVQLQP